MMDWSDRFCRRIFRLLAPRALLYTEMVTAAALEHGDRPKLLDFDPMEQPLALQVGGSDPRLLAQAARLGEQWGYQEINLNVGCPSDRVQQGTFGACLMATPTLVADCVAAMRAAVRVPVTVKCRLGIDDQREEHTFFEFVDAVAKAPTDVFIVHARKAWLKGLSPKQNRDVPPLRYDLVYELKRRRPDLTVILNGGLADLSAVSAALEHVDGVMIGRQAYHHLYFLAEVHQALYPEVAIPNPGELVELLIPMIQADCDAGFKVHASARHLLGLLSHRVGTRRFKQTLTRLSQTNPFEPSIVREALRAAAGS
jgi:tRNA-dihydrouridine synthase A